MGDCKTEDCVIISISLPDEIENPKKLSNGDSDDVSPKIKSKFVAKRLPQYFTAFPGQLLHTL